MKFGVLQFFSWPQRRGPLSAVYERAMERIRIMDQSGYDGVWLAEHHFTDYSVCPSIHMMALHVAHQTKNLRIGTAVSLAPFYHPLRLAEEIALLDVLTNGRVNWGVGRGFESTEFNTFGIPLAESQGRFREAVAIVLQAWTQDKLNWAGEHWQFNDVEVLPKPLQTPHPPVWVAASSPPAIEWAAQQGHSILMDPHSPHAAIAQKWQTYRDVLLANGHSIAGRDIPMARLIAVGKTATEAADIARRGAEWTIGAYETPVTNVELGGGNSPTIHAGKNPVDQYVDDIILHGTPEQLVDQIQELQEDMHLNYLLCAPLSHGSFTLFTEQVLPKLR